MPNYYFNRHNLSNGIEVYINSTPQFITTTMQLGFYSHLTKEASKTSMLSNVLKRGSKDYPTRKDISSRLADLKGSLMVLDARKQGHIQSLCFIIDAITKPVYKGEESPFDATLEILEGIIKKPYLEDGVFSKEYVKQEKENLKRSIMELVNDKSGYAIKRLYQELYPNSPYSIDMDGDVETVEKINEESLYKYFQKTLLESNIKIFITGSKTEEQYLQQLENHFSQLVNGKSFKELLKNKPDYRLDFSRKIPAEKMRGVNESQILTVYQHDVHPRDLSEYSALALYNMILGVSPSSRLFNEIREKHSLAYGTRSGLDTELRLLTCWAGIGDHNNYEKTIGIIKKQINNLKKEEFSREEMVDARKYMIDMAKQELDNPASRIAGIKKMVLNDVFDLQDYSFKRLKSVRKKDIQKIAKKFNADKCLTYFLRPK